MIINLEDITIDAPAGPTRVDDREKGMGIVFEDYYVRGMLLGEYVGSMTVSRKIIINRYSNFHRHDIDGYFFDFSTDPPLPKPYVAFKSIEDRFREHGICGQMTILVNEFYRGKLGTPLYSDTLFCRPFAEKAKNVWRRLQARGLAVFAPYVQTDGSTTDRWHML